MAISVASTQFVTTQKSGLATPDVYSGTSPEKIPTNVGTRTSTGKLETDLVAKSKQTSSATKGRFKAFEDKIREAIDKSPTSTFDDLYKNVKVALGGKDAILKEIKGGLLTDVLTNLGYKDNVDLIAGQILGEKDPMKILGHLGQITPEFQVLLGGVQTIIDAKDLDTAQGIAGVLESLTGDSQLLKVLNLEDEAALVGNTLKKASKLRIPKLIDTIVATVKDDRAKKRLLVSTLPTAAIHSDLETVSSVMEQMSPYGVYTTYPDVIRWLLANYRTLHGGDPTPTDIKEFLTMLKKFDEKWWMTKRGNDEVFNFDLFSNVSPHAKIVLSRTPELKLGGALCNIYQRRDFGGLTEQLRPWIKLPEGMTDKRGEY